MDETEWQKEPLGHRNASHAKSDALCFDGRLLLLTNVKTTKRVQIYTVIKTRSIDYWLVEEETLNELSRNNTSTTLNEKACTEAKFEAQIKKFSGETTTKKQLTRSVDPVLVKKNL